MGIGVAGGIEPLAGKVFGSLRRSHHFVCGLGNGFVGIGGEGFFKGIDRLGCGRQAGEVEAQSAIEAARIFHGIRCEFFLLKFFQNESIDGILYPFLFCYIGNGRFFGAMKDQCSSYFAPCSIQRSNKAS